MKTSHFSGLSFRKAFSILFLGLFFCLHTAYAQEPTDTTTVWQVETKDGNKYYGTISYKDAEKVVLNTKTLGEITLDMSDVLSMDEVSSKRFQDGQYWGTNRQANRYFWAPNAFSLKKGEGYYQNVWVFFNQMSYGITDNVTIGMGLIPVFLLGGDATPIWFTPKVSFPIKKDKFSLGVGALAITVLGDGFDNNFAGITYGVGTLGNKDANLSMGLGYGFAGGDWADAPTLSFSGMLRLSKRSYLMSENYFIGTAEDDVILSLIGGRTVWDSISLDYGLVIPLGAWTDGTLIGIPWLGLVVPFGRKSI